MRHFFRFILFYLFCQLNYFPVLAQNNGEKVKIMLTEIMKKEHIPGLAYAVIKDGSIETMGTLGKASIPFNQDVSRETAFQLASASKIYCSLLLGKLFDLGILKPDQPISELIDSIPYYWNNITVLQLAAHQSGIRIGDFSNCATGRETLERAKQASMEYEPGTQSEYLSSDYWILQYIIEKATGLKYYDALKKYVLIPLSLNHTFVNNPKIGGISDFDIVPQMAQEYHWHKNDSTLRINQMWFGSNGYSAGGIYSSIEDMAKLAQIFDKGNFVSDQTKRLISNPLMLKNGKPGSYGMGLRVNTDYQGYKLVEHSGGPALADIVRFDKEKITFIVLTNNRGLYPYLAKAIATIYIPGLKYPEIPRGWE